MDKLTKQDQDFVKEVALTGNQTASAKKAYGIESDDYARKKGSVQVAKGNINTAIQEVKRTLAERVDIDKLEKVFNEGLEAYKTIKTGENGEEIIEPDFAVRHKYLDTGLKLKGEYGDENKNKINILMPVLVKFLDKNNDDSSNNGDTD